MHSSRIRTAGTLTVGGRGPGQGKGMSTPRGRTPSLRPDHLPPCDLSHDAIGVTPPVEQSEWHMPVKT